MSAAADLQAGWGAAVSSQARCALRRRRGEVKGTALAVGGTAGRAAARESHAERHGAGRGRGQRALARHDWQIDLLLLSLSRRSAKARQTRAGVTAHGRPKDKETSKSLIPAQERSALGGAPVASKSPCPCRRGHLDRQDLRRRLRPQAGHPRTLPRCPPADSARTSPSRCGGLFIYLPRREAIAPLLSFASSSSGTGPCASHSITGRGTCRAGWRRVLRRVTRVMGVKRRDKSSLP